MSTGRNFIAHQVRPMKARQLKTQYLRMLPHNQAHPLLLSPGHSTHHLVAYYGVSQVVMAVRLVRDCCIRQYHQFIVPELHGLDALMDDKSTTITYIVCPKVEPWGAGRPEPQRRRRCVDLVSAMTDRVSEADMHYGT